MKQIKRILFLVSAIVIVVAACKKSSDTASIVGTWIIDSSSSKVTVNGSLYSNYSITFSGKSTWVFNSNGTYVVTPDATSADTVYWGEYTSCRKICC